MIDFAALEEVKSGKNNGDGLAGFGFAFARALHLDDQSPVVRSGIPWSILTRAFSPQTQLRI